MSKCKDCGSKLRHNSTYCNKCGAEQTPPRLEGNGGSYLIPVAVAIIAIAIGMGTLLYFLLT